MADRAELVVIDHGWKKFSIAVRSLVQEHGVRVGVLGDTPLGAQDRGGLSNAEIAAIHEFGSSDGRIPERPFIRPTFETNRVKYVDMLGDLLLQSLEGQMRPEQAFGLVGALFASDIKGYITKSEQIPPPNAPSTIARKVSRELGRLRRALRTVTKKASAGKVASLKELNRLDDAQESFGSARGRVRTLVDTGRMVGAITWKVVTGGQAAAAGEDDDEYGDEGDDA